MEKALVHFKQSSFKGVCLVLSVVFCLALISCSPKEKKRDDVIYTCSMHPQVRQPEPGNCPICGMTLVPAQTSAPKETTSSQQEECDHCLHEQQPQAPIIHLGSARDSVASIRTEPVEERRLHKTIELFGEISAIADQQVDYTWFYGGRVQKVLINFNTTEVKHGEPILKVYSEEGLADQEAYLAALRERWLRTFYERDVLTARVEAIKARLLQAGMTEGELENLVENKKAKSKFILRAPISGSLIKPLPLAGERFSPETVLFSIAPLEKVWFVADVYEKDLPFLQLGQKIDVAAQSRPEKTFEGKLVFIDRIVDPQKRSVQARFEVENSNKSLLPMLSAIGRLHVNTEKTISVPNSAIIDTGKRKVVYVETGDAMYQQREVKVGLEGKTYSIITSGLRADEKVVVSGAFLIDAEADIQGAGSTGHQH